MSISRMQGNILGLEINGTFISCETSCEMSFETDLLPASSVVSGGWKEYIDGAKSWSVTVNAAMLLQMAGAGLNTILNAFITGQQMSIRIASKYEDLTDFSIVGKVRLRSGGFNASVSSMASWNASLEGDGKFSLGDENLFTARYGYRLTDPFGDEVNLQPQFSKKIQIGAEQIDFDFTKASAGFYLFVILPAPQPIFNTWENSQFNFGTLPDQAWREPYIYSDKVIIASRKILFITSEVSTILFKYKNVTTGPFYFQDIVNALRNTIYLSNIITVSQVTEPVHVEASGGFIKINGGSQVTEGFVSAGDTIQAVNLSSSDYNTSTGTLVNVNGVSDSYDVKTQPNSTIYYAYRYRNFTKNDCGSGYQGSVVSFSKTYTSSISQQDADDLAAADVNFDIEGQAFANANGVCSSLSYFVWGNIEYENIENYQGLVWADVFVRTYKGDSATVPPNFAVAPLVSANIGQVPVQQVASGMYPDPPNGLNSVYIVNNSTTRIVNPNQLPNDLYPKIIIGADEGNSQFNVVFTGLGYGIPKMLLQVNP